MRCRLYKIKTIFIIVLSLFIIQSVIADDTVKPLDFNSTYQAGVRLGSWVNGGDIPPAILVDTSGLEYFRSSISDASFYIEGYFAYKLYPAVFTEISFGMVNRGTIEIFQGQTYDLGNLLIYPILLQLKYYPLASTKSKLQPFIGGGGGLYFGRRSIQLTTDYYASYYGSQGESKTDFNYTLSGGFDWALNDKFSIEFHGRYLPIEFSNELLMIKDYKATTITVGFKYRYNKKKK